MKEMYKVLIVDDEGILRNGLKHLFSWEDHGFTIVGEASNGEEALEMVEKQQPHIVITDIVMPIMDGVELVKELHQHYPHIKTIVLSSFSEFKYVREAFKYGASDYLLKPTLKVPELLVLLEKLCKDITTSQVNETTQISTKALLSHLLSSSQENKTSYYEELSSICPSSGFLLLKASLSKVLETTNKNELENLLHKLLKENLSPFTVLDTLLPNEYIVLINLNAHEETLIRNKLKHLLATNAEHLEGLIFVSTHFFTDKEQIRHMSIQLDEVLGKTFYFNNQKLIFESEVICNTYKKEFDLNLFISKIKALNIEESKHFLLEYCKEIILNRNLDEYSFKRFCQNAIYNLINTISHLGFDVSSLNQNKIRLFKSIDMALYINDVLDILENVFNTASHIMSTQLDKRNTIILNKVFEYVNQHFNEEITLSDISTNLHINYYYLSSYFKNHTNENLTAYINKVRVEKAKELLCNLELPISEVSSQVGFSEHNYFCKVFKKYTSHTPSTYRRKCLGGHHA